MDIRSEVNNFVNKLRGQPKSRKKIILWLIVIIIGLSLVFWRYEYWKRTIPQINWQSFKERLKPPI